MSRSLPLAFLLSMCLAATAHAGADLSVGLTVPAKSAIGATVHIAIEVDNNGPDTGGTFTLAYTPPSGYAFAQISGYQYNGGSLSCPPPTAGSNGAITCSGSMRLGAGPNVTLIYNVASSVALGTSMVSSATLTAANDPNAANNTATAASTATAIPDLRPSLTFPPTYTPGVPFHFTMGLRNNGPGTATNYFVLLSHLFDASAIAQTSGPAAQCSSPTFCEGASLASGEQVTFDVTVSPPSDESGPLYAAVEGGLSDFYYDTAPVSASAARAEASNLSVSSSAPATAKIGDDLRYVVSIANAGPSDATGATVTWTTPPGTTFLSAVGDSACTVPAVGTAGTATCPVWLVRTGSPSFVWFDARVATAGTIVNSAAVNCASDSTPSNNTTSATTVVTDTPHADISLSMSGDPYALAGRPASVQLTFHNAGPSPAQSVTANVALPAGVTLDPSSDCGAACSAGDIAVGATVKKNLAIVAAGGVTGAAITATATSITPDLDPSNNTAAASIPVYPAMADLALRVAPLPATAIGPGDELAIAATIVNQGPAPAKATLTFDVPPGAKLLRGNGCMTSGATATCTSAELFAGNTAPFALTIQAPAAAGPYTITFRAASSLSDSNPSDNQTTAGFAVAGTPADLAVSVQPSEVTVAPGAPVAFAIVVENRGADAAANVAISASLPSSMTLVSLSSSSGVCDAAEARCTVASLGAGASAVVNAIVEAQATGTVDVVAAGSAASLRIIVIDHPRRRAVGH